MTPNPNYQSYLLRFWRNGPDQPWRASLRCTVNEEKVVFAEVPALFAYLVEQLTRQESLSVDKVTQEKEKSYEKSSD